MWCLLFFFSIATLFSASPHLVDAECSQNTQQRWLMNLRSGKYASAEMIGWDYAQLEFSNHDRERWDGFVKKDSEVYLVTFLLCEVQDIARAIQAQQAKYTPPTEEDEPILHSVAKILKGVQERDPVRLETFLDALSCCAQ